MIADSKWGRNAAATGRRGGALLMALVLLVVVSILAAGYLQVLSSTTRRQAHETESMKAFYLAEAGLAEAFHAVRIGRTGQVGTQELPAQYGDGLLWVDSTETAEGLLRLESTGMVGGGRAKLALVVEPTELELGFFSDEDLVVESVLLVDGFDSTVGEYEEQVFDPPTETTDPTLSPTVSFGTGTVDQDPTYAKVDSTTGDAYYYDANGNLLYIESGTGATDPTLADSGNTTTTDSVSGWGGDSTTTTTDSTTPIDADVVYDQTSDPETTTDSTATTDPSTSTDSTATTTTTTTTEEALKVHTGGGGLLGSNGNILLGTAGDSFAIYGDVVPGPGGTLTLGGGGWVDGDTEPRSVPVELPPVEVPAVSWQPDVLHGDAVPFVVSPGSVGYPNLEVAENAELVVRGPATVVVGNLVLQPGAVLTMDTLDGPVELYVTGGMDLAPGSQVLTSEQPEDLAVQVAAIPTVGGIAPVQLNATSSFHGTIYAPETEVEIGANFEVFGAVIAKKLVISPGARLHYDHTGMLNSALPKLMAWRIVELPGQVKSNLWSPYLLLGVEESDLPPLSTAHVLDGVWLELEYVSLSGATSTYAGWEGDFDWLAVAEVLDVRRQRPASDGTTDTTGTTTTDQQAPQEPTATLSDAELVAALDQNQGDWSNVATMLVDNSPLSDAVLLAAVMDSDVVPEHLKTVLHENGTSVKGSSLSDQVLIATVNEKVLGDADLIQILIENSPLSADALNAAKWKKPPIDSGLIADLEAAQ